MGLTSIMRVHLIISMVAVAYAAELKGSTPTFSLSEERSFDGSPKINIVFANGKSDTMVLTKFDDGEEDKIETGVEECRYLGHLENEPSACVAMAGCLGVDKVEFTIISENVFDSPAYVWTKEGSVNMIEMENSNWDYREISDGNDTYPPPPVIFEPMDDTTVPPVIFEPMEEDRGNTQWIGDKYCDDGNNNPDFNFDGGDCCLDVYIKAGKDNGYCTECRCKTLQLDLKIGFGDAFSGGWSSQSRDKYIKDAMLLVQPYFCHKSLGHRIRLSYSTNFKHYKGYNFKCNDKYEKAPYNYEAGIYQLDRVEKLVQSELGGADLMVLLGYDSNDFSNNQFLGGTTGIASRGIVCRPQAWEQEKDKWSMNEYSNKGAGGIAATIAHEIGHNIGMKHDHEQAGGVSGPCNCKGVMSYDAHCSVIPVSWSSCSRTDFINQYNAHKNRWCMAAKTSNFCG